MGVLDSDSGVAISALGTRGVVLRGREGLVGQ